MKSVCIEIGDQYRLASDERQWMVQKKRFKNGEVVWESKGYYYTLPDAINGLMRIKVMSSGATNFQELIKAHYDVRDEIKQLIEDALPDYGEYI